MVTRTNLPLFYATIYARTLKAEMIFWFFDTYILVHAWN